MRSQFITATLFVAGIICFSSCKEVGPDINLHGNPNTVSDTTYIESPAESPGAKNVVVEDFSGVQCTNCPQGHVIIDTLQSDYGSRVVPVVYHASNALGNPYPFSLQNLVNLGSTNLLAYLGDQGFEPEGAIDRQLIGCGQGAILMDKSCWTPEVQQELTLTPPVNIVLTSTFSPSTLSATIVVELHYTQNVTQSNSLTVELTEDSVVTAQLNGSIIDTFYVHNSVFRDFVTVNASPFSQTLDSSAVAGTVIRNVYSYTISRANASIWKPAHMNVVAFVQQPGNKVITQGAITKLQN